SHGIIPISWMNIFVGLGVSSASSVTNTIVSFDTYGQTSLNVPNLSHNAYYLPQLSSDPDFGYSSDAAGVTLTRRYPSGMTPAPGSPLYDGGAALGLEYDQLRRPRGTLHTIGPLTGEPLSNPSSVNVGWGERIGPLHPNDILPWVNVRQLIMRFPGDVDVWAT